MKQLLDLFNTLTEKLGQLASTVRVSPLPAWISEETIVESDLIAAGVRSQLERRRIFQTAWPKIEARQERVSASDDARILWSVARIRTANIICELWHTGGEDGRMTTKLPGWVMSDSATLECVESINILKSEFEKEFVANSKKPDALAWVMFEDSLHVALNDWRKGLRFSGNSRIQLRHVYREIPIIKDVVRKIGFSYSAHSKSMTELSRPEAMRRLEDLAELGGDHIQAQIKVLASLPAAAKMIVVQDMTPHLKANIVIDSDPVERITKRCHLPFFIPESSMTPSFTRKKIPSDNERGRLRSDQRIDLVPVLPSLRAHLLREGSN